MKVRKDERIGTQIGEIERERSVWKVRSNDMEGE